MSATRTSRIRVVIPALDEEESIGLVLDALAGTAAPIAEVVVVDNGSRDRTSAVARAAGATVLAEPRRGYGAACLRGLRHLDSADPDDVVVFLDADFSDDPRDLAALLEPIEAGRAQLVIGSRSLLPESRRAVPWPSRVGNWLATRVMRLLYGVRYSDLGPFRAITLRALRALGMRDQTWGWTLEMQIKASRRGLRAVEVPVRYRARHAGESKISGNLWGGAKAAYKILCVLGLYCVRDALRATT